MAYVPVSIPRPENGGAAPVAKRKIIIVDVKDVETEPARTLGATSISGDYTLANGKKGVQIYGTPTTIAITEEQSGNPDGRGLIKGVEFEHPGDSVAIANHKEYFLNKGVIIFVTECDGVSGNGRTRVIGSVCNPLYMQPEYTNSNEGTRNKFVYKQEMADQFTVGTYTGALPTVADEAQSGESA